MNKASLCSCLLACVCLNGSAQTNVPPAMAHPFVVPALELRPLDKPAQESGFSLSQTNPIRLELIAHSDLPAGLSLAPPTNSVPGVASAVLSRGTYDGEFYGPLQPGKFYLVEPERPSDNAVVRTFEGIFDPEPVRLGKTTLSCSIVTAIKRKNPLCLLNPIFFQLSW